MRPSSWGRGDNVGGNSTVADGPTVCGVMRVVEPSFLSVAEAARTLGLSEDTIYRRVADGSLPALRLTAHGAIRIPRTAVESPARAPRSGTTPAVEAQAHGGSIEAA